MANIKNLARDLLSIIHEDSERLEQIDDYLHGRHADPYMPPSADDEYKLLAERATNNWVPLVVGTPAQALYVDGFRPGREGPRGKHREIPEWDHWQESGMDAKQVAIHRAAIAYGHAFVVTERDKQGRVRSRGLSPLRTSALFRDAANDNDPYAALTITDYGSTKDKRKGRAILWDGTRRYDVRFDSLGGTEGITLGLGVVHGAPECPVTRFAAHVDLEGRTIGVVEPMIPLQDRINQTIFDLLVAQTYTSFEVRWATGMAPPTTVKWINPETGEEVDPSFAGAEERRVPIPMNHNAKRFLFAEDHESKFGSLPAGNLSGFIESIDMSIRHLAAITQTPPHHLLGQIANLSAEALQAAETSLSRKIEEFRKVLGESWERVFRIAGALSDDPSVFEDYHGEVLWRDMEQRSLAQAADAYGKIAESLGVPKRALWERVPNVTQAELNRWDELFEEDDLERRLNAALMDAAQGVESEQVTPVDA